MTTDQSFHALWRTRTRSRFTGCLSRANLLYHVAEIVKGGSLVPCHVAAIVHGPISYANLSVFAQRHFSIGRLPGRARLGDSLAINPSSAASESTVAGPQGGGFLA